MASWCCPVRKKKRRSGVTPKGSSRRLKWERYMMNYSVAVGSGQDGEAREIFEFAGLLNGVTEVLGAEGDAKTEEAGQEDSQGQVQRHVGLGRNVRQGGGLGDGYVGDFLLVEGFGDARFFRLLGIQQVVVFGFFLGADQVVKRGGGEIGRA